MHNASMRGEAGNGFTSFFMARACYDTADAPDMLFRLPVVESKAEY